MSSSKQFSFKCIDVQSCSKFRKLLLTSTRYELYKISYSIHFPWLPTILEHSMSSMCCFVMNRLPPGKIIAFTFKGKGWSAISTQLVKTRRTQRHNKLNTLALARVKYSGVSQNEILSLYQSQMINSGSKEFLNLFLRRF